ncbi:MAG: D-arabinono-1,4-lactone oxidase, partial [Pirellulaceae bacterium]
LDFPHTGDDLNHLIADLDRILLKYSGRLYLAKDAMMDASTFTSMYPRLAEFQAVKARIDPENRFGSSQARRLGIVPV